MSLQLTFERLLLLTNILPNIDDEGSGVNEITYYDDWCIILTLDNFFYIYLWFVEENIDVFEKCAFKNRKLVFQILNNIKIQLIYIATATSSFFFVTSLKNDIS